MNNRRLIIHVDFDTTDNVINEEDIEYECTRALDKYGYIGTSVCWVDIPEEELQCEHDLNISMRACEACVNHSRLISDRECVGCFDFTNHPDFKPRKSYKEEDDGDLDPGKCVTIIMEVE